MKKLLILLLALFMFLSCKIDTPPPMPQQEQEQTQESGQEQEQGQEQGQAQEPKTYDTTPLVTAPKDVPDASEFREKDENAFKISVELFKLINDEEDLTKRALEIEGTEIIAISETEINASGVLIIKSGAKLRKPLYQVINGEVTLSKTTYVVDELSIDEVSGRKYISGTVKVGDKTFTGDEAIIQYDKLRKAMIYTNRTKSSNTKIEGSDYTYLKTFTEHINSSNKDVGYDFNLEFTKGKHVIKYGRQQLPNESGTLENHFLYFFQDNVYYSKAVVDEIEEALKK